MKYTTAKGDTWDIIAYEVYGNEELIAPLIEANPEYTETAVFDWGIELDVPDIDTVDDTALLPPWRR